MIYFYCTSWQFFQMIVKWRISPTTEQIMFTFSILLFHFYSHIPCGMWRIPKLKHFVLLRFLLTHPVWDVTQHFLQLLLFLLISTHTSRVGCDRNLCFSLNAIDGISTHTSRVGCDPAETPGNDTGGRFLLTHPVWDVTFVFLLWKRKIDISTHTSRVGCDRYSTQNPQYNCYFYSHIPCGMWRYDLF